MKVVNNVTVAPEFSVSAMVLGAAVTPSDTALLSDATHGLYVGGTGDVTVIFAEDATNTPVTFKAVPVGAVLPVSVIRVMATNTTATNIVAVF